jgi:hypothetical protein
LTAQGHPRTIFKRAIEKESLVIAEATAREIAPLTLDEALDLLGLVARKEPQRHGRMAARWLRRYLEQNETATLNDVALVVLHLTALRSATGNAAALAVLRGALVQKSE